MREQVAGCKGEASAAARTRAADAQFKLGSTLIRLLAVIALGIILTGTPTALANSEPLSKPTVGHPPEIEVQAPAEPVLARLGWMCLGAVIGATMFHGVTFVVEVIGKRLRPVKPGCYVLRDGEPITDAEVVTNGTTRPLIEIGQAHNFDVPPEWKPGHHVKILSSRRVLAEAILRQDSDTGEFYLEFTSPA